jgi:glycosyltransferase involved in cell wall biosynthesis
MSRIPASPPVIPSISPGAVRPVWSVMIPIFNGSRFLKEALESVLMQDPGKDIMQIEVVDDCSTDADVKEMVETIGKGRIAYYRQEQNCGSIRNFETCINRAMGHFIHLLHCDDMVKEGFYTTIAGVFEQFPEAAAAFCAFETINERGDIIGRSKPEAPLPTVLHDLLFTLAVRQPIQYVSMVVRREVYEKLGSFYGVIYGEDWEMWARIAKNYPVAYTPETLAKYRTHLETISTNSFIEGSHLLDMDKVISAISTYLPEPDRKKLGRMARKGYAAYSLMYTEKLFRRDQLKRSPYKHIRQTLSFYNDVDTTGRVLRFLLLIWFIPVLRPMKKYIVSK